MVDERIANILDSRAEIVPTYEERPLAKDDYVSVKYDTYVTYEDGEEKKEQDGMKTEIFLGSETIRPEVARSPHREEPRRESFDRASERRRRGQEGEGRKEPLRDRGSSA